VNTRRNRTERTSTGTGTGGAGSNGSVVCLGACAVDLVIKVPHLPAPDEMVFAEAPPQALPGGSTANIATGLARLGHPCRFVGKVGDDDNGRLLSDAFLRDGVDARHLVADSGGRTAQTIIAVDAAGSRTIISLGGTALLERPEEFVPDMLCGAAMLYVGEAFPSVAAHAIKMARSLGATIVFGPGGGLSWIEPDELRRLMGAADYVLLSRHELEAAAQALSGQSGPDCAECPRTAAATAARAILAAGAKHVVATLGELGSALYSGNLRIAGSGIGPEENATPAPGAVYAKRFDVQVLDTTGAGDAFAAGFLSGLLMGLPPPRCLVRGNACAALAIGKVGAREAMPTLRQLEAFLQARGVADE
jgi:ribokinase